MDNMDNEKNVSYEEEGNTDDGASGVEHSAPRARNRTVMLTPEITGEVRARLAQDMAADAPPVPEPSAGWTRPC